MFEAAVQAEWLDDREDCGEERWNVIGLVEDVELIVTYTQRSEDVRIISARRLTKYERENFWGD